LKKKAGGIGFNFFRTKIRLSLSPARLSLGLTELDKSYGIYFNTTLISQNMNKVLLSVTGYINPAPMSSLSWLTKREMLRASSNTGELVMELRSETVTAVFFNSLGNKLLNSSLICSINSLPQALTCLFNLRCCCCCCSCCCCCCCCCCRCCNLSGGGRFGSCIILFIVIIKSSSCCGGGGGGGTWK